LSKYFIGLIGPGVLEKQIVNLLDISIIDYKIITLGRSNALQNDIAYTP
jgi:hypothetical protein